MLKGSYNTLGTIHIKIEVISSKAKKIWRRLSKQKALEKTMAEW